MSEVNNVNWARTVPEGYLAIGCTNDIRDPKEYNSILHISFLTVNENSAFCSLITSSSAVARSMILVQVVIPTGTRAHLRFVTLEHTQFDPFFLRRWLFQL